MNVTFFWFDYCTFNGNVRGSMSIQARTEPEAAEKLEQQVGPCKWIEGYDSPAVLEIQGRPW